MNFQQAIQFLDQHLESFRSRKMTAAEQVALKAAWFDIRYDEALVDSTEISSNYVRSRVAPEFWRTLSACFDQHLKKKNIRRFLEAQVASPSPQTEYLSKPLIAALELKNLAFVGRQSEIDYLINLVDHNQCINICGESGIGKSHLIRYLMQTSVWASVFDQVIWTSVCHAPELTTLCQSLLQEFGLTADDADPYASRSMDMLFDVLKSQRSLIILDSAETWMTQNVNVDSFLRRACEDTIRSVIVILSRSPFPIVSALQSKRYPARIFRLEGLELQDAFKILELHALQDPDAWPQLIQKYRANPLALIQASEMILNLFGGRVKHFIDLETTVVFDTFEEAYRGYPFSQEEINLLRVVQESEPASISDIISSCNQSHSTVIVLLNTLLENSFLDRNMMQDGYVYSVPPMLKKFLNQQLATAGES